MREDILGGLKNALERGSSLEEAIRSFTNAGYIEKEVREAATFIQSSGLQVSQQAPTKKFNPLDFTHRPQAQNQQVFQQNQQMQQKQIQTQYVPRRNIPWMLIILLSILGLLIITLMASLVFKEQIVAFLRG
ncbi:MAG: hypothetical protein AABW79_00105 [Nanoarchaeota archaeon]